MRLLNTIKYDWSNTPTLLYHLPKNDRNLLLRLRCSIYFLTCMNPTNPLITADNSSVQELGSRLFKTEVIHTSKKLRYLNASISVCLIKFENLVFYFLYFGTVSVFPQLAHSWVVEFQSHNRGHRDTRLCTSRVFNALRYIPYLQFLPVASYPYASSSSHTSPLSAAAADITLPPTRYSPYCYHHLL